MPACRCGFVYKWGQNGLRNTCQPPPLPSRRHDEKKKKKVKKKQTSFPFMAPADTCLLLQYRSVSVGARCYA